MSCTWIYFSFLSCALQVISIKAWPNPILWSYENEYYWAALPRWKRFISGVREQHELEKHGHDDGVMTLCDRKRIGICMMGQHELCTGNGTLSILCSTYVDDGSSETYDWTDPRAQPFFQVRLSLHSDPLTFEEFLNQMRDIVLHARRWWTWCVGVSARNSVSLPSWWATVWSPWQRRLEY